ncbi:inositol monophosphatase [candidate division KSB1 bacterium]|nr:MAG: inositol monophosphatase [candidate division KSB1 bacterium]
MVSILFLQPEPCQRTADGQIEMFDPQIFKHAGSFSKETEIALQAAQRGGDVLLKFWRQLQDSQIQEKGIGDLVTSADVASEGAVSEFLRSEMPEIALVSEEGTLAEGRGAVWYIDPLDGTTNFVQQFPVFAVSIGLAATSDRGHASLLCGVVYNPVSGDVFYGARNCGSFLNGKRLHVSGKKKIADAVLATGFPRRHHEELPVYLREFDVVFRQCRAVRRAGAASLDLCWTAQGIFDGFWEHRLSPWDVAAGALIVEEAGGVCTDFSGTRTFLDDGNILGAPPAIHHAMLKILKEVRDSG